MRGITLQGQASSAAIFSYRVGAVPDPALSPLDSGPSAPLDLRLAPEKTKGNN